MNGMKLSEMLNRLPDDMILAAYTGSYRTAQPKSAADFAAGQAVQRGSTAGISAPRWITAAALAACMLFAVGVAAVLIRSGNEEVTVQSVQDDSAVQEITAEYTDISSVSAELTVKSNQTETLTELKQGDYAITSDSKIMATEPGTGLTVGSVNTFNINQNTVSTTNNTHQAEQTSDSPKSSSTATESYEQRMKAEYDAVVDNAVSNLPYNDVIKSTVSDDIILWHLDETMNPWMSRSEGPVSMNNRYKIELIRKIDDKRMYSIQKPESGGLFYSFYVSSGLQCTAYITKALSFADYSAIKTGSSIDDVIAIEPATTAYVNRNKVYDEMSDEEAVSFPQHIILTDGLLKLTYVKSEDTYKVDRLDFFDDFKESVDYGMGYPCIYDYSILPEDYPS